ncbi:hypothetical protein PN498_18185, partial [Oscillatoria sp. CS-180]|nr:hypothetical protein [Oscillatoria sp. CS-180]
PLFTEALQAARDIQDNDARAFALRALAPHLPEPLFTEALQAARDIQHDDDRGSALSALAPHLPKPLFTEALQAARDVQSDSARASVLSALAPHLPESLFTEALQAARDIQHYSARASALSSYLDRLNWQDRDYPFWQGLLHALSAQERPSFIADLPKLRSGLIRFGGEDIILGVVQAMKEVCRQWG